MLYLAVSLLLVHLIVPHHHHGNEVSILAMEDDHDCCYADEETYGANHQDEESKHTDKCSLTNYHAVVSAKVNDSKQVNQKQLLMKLFNVDHFLNTEILNPNNNFNSETWFYLQIVYQLVNKEQFGDDDLRAPPSLA